MLRLVAAVSGVYDVGLGLLMLFAAAPMAAVFGTPSPQPPVLAGTNGLFLLAVGAGYWLPFRSPDLHRPYLWLMGPFLKGAGAALFILDFIIRRSPPAFLLFAACDGSLALWTWWALRRAPRAAR